MGSVNPSKSSKWDNFALDALNQNLKEASFRTEMFKAD